MDKEIESVIHISIELILCALIISVIALLSFIGNSAYASREVERVSTDKMNTMSEMYNYDNKVVSYSDIVELITTYKDTYDYYIQVPTSFNLSPNNTNVEVHSTYKLIKIQNLGRAEYNSESYIAMITDGLSGHQYDSEVVWDTVGNSIEYIYFTCRR